jgi:hypothetical protein
MPTSADDLASVEVAVAAGARFVVYQYCVSLLFVSFRRSSDVKFVRPGLNRLATGLPYTVMSLIAGWWGVPWGPLWTVQTVYRNTRGGIDVTRLFSESTALSGGWEGSSVGGPTGGDRLAGVGFYLFAFPILIFMIIGMLALTLGVAALNLLAPEAAVDPELALKGVVALTIGVDIVAFWFVKLRKRSASKEVTTP